MGDRDDADKMVRELMQKNKRLVEDRDDLNEQMKGLMTKLNVVKEEAEDARIAAEAANKDKSNVEKDWSTRLIKVCLQSIVLISTKISVIHSDCFLLFISIKVFSIISLYNFDNTVNA